MNNTSTMICKMIPFAMATFMSMQLFAEQLPLYNGRKVIGVEFAKGGDFMWRGNLVAVDKNGRKCLEQVFPNNEYPYFSRSAYEYYEKNMADIPILPKTKLKDSNAEALRQIWIKRRQDAIKRREEKSKEASERLSKAVIMYSRLNTLFGQKIGTVFDVSNLDKPKESTPIRMRGILFTPDKPFLTFDKYTLGITPISHRIFSITASAPYSKQTLELAKDALEKKFSDTLRYDAVRNEYSTFGLNAKENMRSLILGKEGDRLTLTLLDAMGLELSDKEYKQQKDKVSSEATSAL